MITAQLGQDPWIPARTVDVPITTRAFDATVAVELHSVELNRRSASATPRLRSLDMLNLLLEMPLGVPVPVDLDDSYRRNLLRRANRLNVVSLLTGDGRPEAKRIADVPLRIVHVQVRCERGWRRALDATSRFAPYGSRELILSREPRDRELLALEASYLGIGVSVGRPEGPVTNLVPCAPFERERFTGAAWLMAERLLEALLRAPVETLEIQPG
jgi:hypothetical protein